MRSVKPHHQLMLLKQVFFEFIFGIVPELQAGMERLSMFESA